jgi:RNA polymerase sigma-70 factor (ECF subfamily)
LRRVASEHARAARRRQRRLLGVDPPPPVAGPDRDLQAKQAAALMDAFLAGLSEAHREVFVLADLEGWTAPEIAEALRTRVGTVYSRLHHARARFEAALGAWRAGGRA